MKAGASVLEANLHRYTRNAAKGRPPHTRNRTQNSVDMPVTLPQYLVLKGEPIPKVGLHRQ